MIRDQAHKILAVTSLSLFLYGAVASCNPFSGKSLLSEAEMILTLIYPKASQGNQSAPQYRWNAYLQDLEGNPLPNYRLRYDGVIRLTDEFGFFSVFLGIGDHRVDVMDSQNASIGKFGFSILENPASVRPTIAYSHAAPFRVEWVETVVLSNSTASNESLNRDTAILTINEVGFSLTTEQTRVASELPNPIAYIELYAIQGGTISSSSLCVGNLCTALPNVSVRAGDYIVIQEGSGRNDQRISDGSFSYYWEFYNLPSLPRTDGHIAVISPEGTLQSELFYGSKNANLQYESNDSLFRCPNGNQTNQKSAYVYSNQSTHKTIGLQNSFCPGFQILTAEPTSPDSLTLSFSTIPGLGSDTAHNYHIYQNPTSENQCSGSALPVISVHSDESNVFLTTAEQIPGAYYTVCISNILGGLNLSPLSPNSLGFIGYAPPAIITLNELAPGLPNGTDYVEIYALEGGSLRDFQLCNRHNCVGFPNRLVKSGEYIIYYSESGIHDQVITDGRDPDSWEFYGAPNMETTDSIVTIRKGRIILSAVAYANGDGNWTGGTEIQTAVTQGRWTQFGINWNEASALQKTPRGNFGANDTLIKLPNAAPLDNQETWIVSAHPAQRSVGRPNLAPPKLQAKDIVINELRRQASAHWLELYNRTNESIDLALAGIHIHRIATCNSNWATNTVNSIALMGTIPANGYYVLATAPGHPGNEDQVGGLSALGDSNCIFLSNSNVRPVSLEDSGIIDLVGYGSAIAFEGSPANNLTNGSILQRYPDGNKTSDNQIAFHLLPACSGTPKSANQSTCPEVHPPISLPTPDTTPPGSPPVPATNLILNGSFEEDTNSCTTAMSPSSCPNQWVFTLSSSGTAQFQALEGTTPNGGGSHFGTINTWTTSYANREIRSNCFPIDKSKHLEISGFFAKDNPNSNQIRFLLYYFTDSNCTTTADLAQKTFSGHSISDQDIWEEKTSIELPSAYPPNDTVYARLAIQGQRGTSGRIRFDRISVTQP